MTILSGNVKVSHSTISITGDKAWIYHNEQRVIVNNNVKIIDKNTIITANRAIYQRKNNKLSLFGPVTIQDTSLTLKARNMFYYRDKQKIEAKGDIEIIDETNDTKLTGQNLIYNRNEEYGVLTGSPILKTIEKKQDEEIIISSDKMEFFRKDERAIATSNVQITRGDVIANCLVATYYNKEEKFVLSGNPTVRQDKNSMSADEIQLFIENDQFKKAKLLGNAKVNYNPPDSSAVKENSLIIGENVILEFEDEKIRFIQIEGNAKSIYYPDEKDLIGDKNVVIGGKMRLYIENDKISKVIIEERAIGTYRFFEEVK